MGRVRAKLHTKLEKSRVTQEPIMKTGNGNALRLGAASEMSRSAYRIEAGASKPLPVAHPRLSTAARLPHHRRRNQRPLRQLRSPRRNRHQLRETPSHPDGCLRRMHGAAAHRSNCRGAPVAWKPELQMIQRWIITPVEEMTYKLAVFKTLTQQALALRQAELQKARLEIQRARLELLLEKQRNKSASSSTSAPSSSGEASRRSPASVDAPAKAADESPKTTAKPHAPSPAPTTANPPSGHRNEEPARQESAVATNGNLPAPSNPVVRQALPANSHRHAGGPPRNATPRNPLGLL
jgi:hypothetical protein